ncbi:Uncharacterised protein [Mycobacteroides abscessus subsp. abscessus]|nr:Uncharacterised protein [Mycobacteroides abscessus subsp. abscessus]
MPRAITCGSAKIATSMASMCANCAPSAWATRIPMPSCSSIAAAGRFTSSGVYAATISWL